MQHIQRAHAVGSEKKNFSLRVYTSEIILHFPFGNVEVLNVHNSEHA